MSPVGAEMAAAALTGWRSGSGGRCVERRGVGGWARMRAGRERMRQRMFGNMLLFCFWRDGLVSLWSWVELGEESVG